MIRGQLLKITDAVFEADEVGIGLSQGFHGLSGIKAVGSVVEDHAATSGFQHCRRMSAQPLLRGCSQIRRKRQKSICPGFFG